MHPSPALRLPAFLAAAAVAVALPDRVSVSLGPSHPDTSAGRGASRSAAGLGHTGPRLHRGVDGGTCQGEASYGHALFQELFDSLDKVISKISPVTQSRTQDGCSVRTTSFNNLEMDTSNRARSVEGSSTATPSPSWCRGNDGKHLRSPRSVAEIRNSGGYSVVPPMQRNAERNLDVSSPPPDPPPYAASEMVSPRQIPAEGCDQLPKPTACTSYVRGVTEHLLRMAAAKSGRARQPAQYGLKTSSSLASQVLQGTTHGFQEAKRLLLGDTELDDSESSSDADARREIGGGYADVCTESAASAIHGSTAELAISRPVVDFPANGSESEAGERRGSDAGFVTPRKQERETRGHLGAGWMGDSDSPTTYRAVQGSPWQDYVDHHGRRGRVLGEEASCAPAHSKELKAVGSEVGREHAAVDSVADSVSPAPVPGCGKRREESGKGRALVALQDLGEEKADGGVACANVVRGEQGATWEGGSKAVTVEPGLESRGGGSMLQQALLDPQASGNLTVGAEAQLAGLEPSSSRVASSAHSSVRMKYGFVTLLPADSRACKALVLAAVGYGCWRVLSRLTMRPQTYSPVRNHFGASLLDVPLSILDTILVDS